MHWFFGHKSLMVAITAIPVVFIIAFELYTKLPYFDTKEDHLAAGIELRQQGKLVHAIAEFDEALKLSPGSVRVLTERGHAYYDLGDFDHALQDYHKSISFKSVIISDTFRSGYSFNERALAGAYAGRALIHAALGDDLNAQRSMGQAVEMGYDPSLGAQAINEIKASR